MQVFSQAPKSSKVDTHKLQERIVDTIMPSIGRGSVTEYDIPMSLSREEDEQSLVKKEDLIERETNLDQRTSPMNMR